ncbi:hypothetical protein, partial [Mitsuokella jalaludinii]|uniref:hypothetical protein n=1 Tax=Mitsuokella jalaludinii TaxID=187979 RepID=UPI0020D16A3F
DARAAPLVRDHRAQRQVRRVDAILSLNSLENSSSPYALGMITTIFFLLGIEFITFLYISHIAHLSLPKQHAKIIFSPP